jgi:3-hydroxyacyl-CoA dehydrogenase
MSSIHNHRICLIGVGTIGISFAALHLRYSKAVVSIYDTRPDLQPHLESVLPGYIDSTEPSLGVHELLSSGRLIICNSLAKACKGATIVQEQGPENSSFKQSIWPQVEQLVSPSTHLWSSTSGIPASVQSRDMKDKSRLLVVHPFNPPHILPLLEIVPSPETNAEEVDFVRHYFTTLNSGHRPIVIHKEVSGFVGNRLAFTLLREACSLVHEGVITAADLDTLVESSIGPRWAVQGPFKTYNLGGSTGGLAAFLANLSGTIQDVWDDQKPVNFDREADRQTDWETTVVRQTDDAYGKPDAKAYAVRDEALRKVLDVQKSVQP